MVLFLGKPSDDPLKTVKVGMIRVEESAIGNPVEQNQRKKGRASV